ncbi:ABC-type branched-chain amino acid transport system, substrate-binding protein [Lishizhenia tianjinensis]|uniref:ABC-type branched-chain amino acid transport system, substrate-binding protein n=2 Tax=Lishizhenia tianjinensis TaxID=477690 RepID=A0A1I6XFU6_9FLAO|nr:ABC-type branched-chain amino acid transport system, substrate-binding protein [Lishizhenia tianjinensis]
MLLVSCTEERINEVHIGFIGPQTARATNLGIAPGQAMQLAIKQYNTSRKEGEPKLILHLADDQWDASRSVPLYNQLRTEFDIDAVFISNSNGTIALKDHLLKDNLIAINPLNNDEELRENTNNTYFIAKRTEQANKVIANRLLQLGKKKVAIFRPDYNFFVVAAQTIKDELAPRGIQVDIIPTKLNQRDYTLELSMLKDEGIEAYGFFGYVELGFAMRQARDLGITAPFFGCTEVLDEKFYTYSEGAISGIEFSYFTRLDGNPTLANEFFENFRLEYGQTPPSDWPPMQAYDAMNIFISCIRDINDLGLSKNELTNHLNNKLQNIKNYAGICGFLNMNTNKSIQGINFNLYQLTNKGETEKVFTQYP